MPGKYWDIIRVNKDAVIIQPRKMKNVLQIVVH